MNDKEYTYDIGKYTIGVDENGEDGIGLTVAKVENGEICFLGNCYGENARCLDLLIKENQELKKQVEDLFSENRNLRKKLENCMTFEDYKYTLNKKIKLETQQKEFIKYLEDEIKLYENDIQTFSKNYNVYFSLINDLKVGKARTKDILQKYKEIIGE